MVCPDNFAISLTQTSSAADTLGEGSTQGTTVSGNVGNDDAFWETLNANVKNIHAVISGHGASFCPIPSDGTMTTFVADHGDEWCAREPTQDVIFCFAKHSGFVVFRLHKRAPPTDVN